MRPNHEKKLSVALCAMLFRALPVRQGAAAKVPRIGVLLQGGPWYDAIDGLRHGLKQLGLEEGKQYVLDIRDAKGDMKAIEEAARSLEREKVKLIYAVATSVVTAAKQATTDTPIVFVAGS